jgi:NADH:ubiquinone oxidoreductase subunit 4 (subunit M)
MPDATLLNVVLFLPIAGIAALLAVPARKDGLVRGLSLATMLLQFALAAWLYIRFDPAVDSCC